MTEEDRIIQLYHEMYEATVQKERAVPERVRDGSFVLARKEHLSLRQGL